MHSIISLSIYLSLHNSIEICTKTGAWKSNRIEVNRSMQIEQNAWVSRWNHCQIKISKVSFSNFCSQNLHRGDGLKGFNIFLWKCLNFLWSTCTWAVMNTRFEAFCSSEELNIKTGKTLPPHRSVGSGWCWQHRGNKDPTKFEADEATKCQAKKWWCGSEKEGQGWKWEEWRSKDEKQNKIEKQVKREEKQAQIEIKSKIDEKRKWKAKTPIKQRIKHHIKQRIKQHIKAMKARTKRVQHTKRITATEGHKTHKGAKKQQTIRAQNTKAQRKHMGAQTRRRIKQGNKGNTLRRKRSKHKADANTQSA